MRPALALLALLAALPAQGIERIRLRAAAVSMEGMAAQGVDATLSITSATRSTADLHAARLTLPGELTAQTGALTDLRVRCENPQVREPRYACPQLEARLTTGRFGTQTVRGDVVLHADTGALQARGSGPVIAGAPLTFEVRSDRDGLQAHATLKGITAAELRRLAAPYATLPTDLTVEGRADLSAELQQRAGSLQAKVALDVTGAGFQNEAYTFIGEKLAFHVEGSAELAALPYSFEVRVGDTQGQALAGPVMLDFAQNPLTLQMAGRYDGERVELTAVRSSQRDLAEVEASARARLSPFSIERAQLDVKSLRFPAAYATYMQVSLATTPFNQLTTAGHATARIQVRDDLPVAVDFALQDLAFSDTSRNLDVTGVASELHWTADVTDPRASWLAWESSRGWGIVGARTRLDFIAAGRDFQLLKPARLPFFDGALLVNRLAAENIGSENLSGEFDAVIEPISVGPIAQAMGWPAFSGKLSGRIPGLTYREGVLSLAGNVEADVFDGRVVASGLRVRDPLGQWPRLYGNIVARNLDLDLITRTFEFGSITGRLDVDLANLETFNWTPVAFDLKLATPARDKSRHRISQRAVQNLSDIGGGGGGVAAALQSGALKFFDDFGYDRLGLSCRLRNDVCQMDGVGRKGEGFYIVKGRGLPRIDIIGNNRRVDWPLLMQQVSDALANPQGIDVK